MAQGRIEIEPGGPYRVHGVGLSRTAQVETEFGEPVDWEPESPVPVDADPYEVCRCGRTSTQPLCDRRGCEAGFDGTEVADRGSRADRAYPYRGSGFEMSDDITLCSQAGYCGDRFTTVWDMLEDSGDPEVRARIRRMVMLCPSGRLAYRADGAEGPDEHAHGPGVSAIRGGPLWVRGGVEVLGADGHAYEVRHRMTLCRCGGSSNKPFCDGSHQTNGFRDG
ncbi:MAG TPA: CDGSH iron-sulfur domain-containing protein [Actinomycetota bacterium]|nr:CDGSH iron-sulfur domain-containing protein [Actinomycetota bacterium]